MFVISMFFLLNDLSDELDFLSNSSDETAAQAYNQQRRWAFSFKLFSAAYIMIAICLVIY